MLSFERAVAIEEAEAVPSPSSPSCSSAFPRRESKSKPDPAQIRIRTAFPSVATSSVSLRESRPSSDRGEKLTILIFFAVSEAEAKGVLVFGIAERTLASDEEEDEEAEERTPTRASLSGSDDDNDDDNSDDDDDGGVVP